MMANSSIDAPGAPRPVGPYPHARRVGNLLFLSGIGPRSAADDTVPGTICDESGKVVEYDFEQQCRAVFRNVRSVLNAAGAEIDDLVDVTVFLTDMEEDFETMNSVYSEYVPSPGPTRTTVEVRSLPTQIAIELKCIAALR